MFAAESHMYPQTATIDYIVVGYLAKVDFYEVDGPWVGQGLSFKTVEGS